MWFAVRTKQFKKSYKKLSADLQKKTNDAIQNLMESESPAKMGIPKKGRYKGYNAYDLGRS